VATAERAWHDAFVAELRDLHDRDDALGAGRA
jgi:hypothetical protein